MYEFIPNMGQIPPCDSFRLGHQNDGAGHLWCVLANTPHGTIPGKAKQGRAWYAYGGKEHETTNFQYVRVHAGGHVVLEKSPFPPAGTITGYQSDSGTYYMVVCHHTHHGQIPGKSNGQSAWYSWGGREMETRDFSYVVVKGRSGPPHHHGGFNPGFLPGPRPHGPHHHGGFGPHHGPHHGPRHGHRGRGHH